MNAFIALEKYIVKEEKDFGVGVPVAFSEETARHESTRKKNVQSYNNWMLIDIPEEKLFLDVQKPIREQSDDIVNILCGKDAVMSVFIHEAKILYDKMDLFVQGKDAKAESERLFKEFADEKRDFIMGLQSGLELFNFINSKCITHDKGKSSSLLYGFGIKGCRYSDETGERLFMYNAKKDIEPIEYRNSMLPDSRLNP